MKKEYDIFLEECGSCCPIKDGCPHKELGVCTMEEPWYDCADFIQEHESDIFYAETRIEEELN